MKLFSLIYQGDIHLSEEQKIISADQYSELLSAEEVLRKAREESERQKRENDEECALKLQEAEERGFAKGLDSFNEHLLDFDKQIKTLRLEMQQSVLPLALKAAKKIVAKQLELHPETIVDIVMQAIGPVSQSRKVKIYLNKVDREIIELHKQRIKDILEHLDTLTIQERSDVAQGGCIIETESGIINASIENQWRALEAAFERYMKPST